MNICMFSGRLGKEPEITELKNGKQKATFSIAVDNPYKDKDGKWHNETEWHNVTTYNQRLIEKVLNAFALKGRLVHVVGAYRARPYERNGDKRTWYELEVKKFEDFALIETPDADSSSGDEEEAE